MKMTVDEVRDLYRRIDKGWVALDRLGEMSVRARGRKLARIDQSCGAVYEHIVKWQDRINCALLVDEAGKSILSPILIHRLSGKVVTMKPHIAGPVSIRNPDGEVWVLQQG